MLGMEMRFRGWRRSTLCGALAGVLIATAALAQGGNFETFEPRPTQDVVPAGLIAGPHYRLAPTVQTVGYLNNFIVSSDYGTFAAPSDTMLRRLVREIHAIAVLHDITLTDSYAQALKQAALGPVRGVKALVNEPVATVKAVPGAVFNIFSRAGQSISTATSGEKTRYEDTGMAQALQMSSYKRDYAKQLGVDPYSSNPVLQKQLDSVAWAAAAGGLTLGAATMASGSEVVAGLSYARNLDQAREIVAADPPAELMIRDKAALDKMGIDRRLRDQFLAQKQYSPRAKTILVSALAGMPQTTGKANLLAVALGAPDEVTAIFYQQMAELLDGYDDRVAHITRLDRYNRLVVARDVNGKTIVLAPLDYLIWDERAASAATGIAKALKLRPGGDQLQFWITGTASPRFKQEAQVLGVSVKEGVGKQLPLLD
jgi:hypothetical protein